MSYTFLGGFLPQYGPVISEFASGSNPLLVNAYNTPTTGPVSITDGARWGMADYQTPNWLDVVQEARDTSIGSGPFGAYSSLYNSTTIQGIYPQTSWSGGARIVDGTDYYDAYFSGYATSDIHGFCGAHLICTASGMPFGSTVVEGGQVGMYADNTVEPARVVATDTTNNSPFAPWSASTLIASAYPSTGIQWRTSGGASSTESYNASLKMSHVDGALRVVTPTGKGFFVNGVQIGPLGV